MILTPGTLLQNGKYKVVRYIAKGGFGITYEALNTTAHNRRVAIKELFVSDFCNRDDNGYVTVPTKSKQPLFEKLRSKFMDEANTLFDLNHHGIVRVLDYFEENATAYYVMEYIEGSSLREKIKAGGKLRETTAVDYVRQVAEALRYVHEHNILHLDIKPANIMIKGDEKTVSDTTGAATDKGVVLIDFGVSKQYDEVSGENTSTLMGRSPGYAPVEQMMSKVGTFTPATDIYSLGATLYTLLTGEVPPESTALSSGEKLPPLPAEISASTRQAVAAAMTTNKYDRPQSIADFLAILDGKRGVTPPPPAPRRSKKNLWVALAVVVGLICGVAGYTHFSGRGSAPAPAAHEAVVTDTLATDSIDVAEVAALIHNVTSPEDGATDQTEEMSRLQAENDRMREQLRQDSIANAQREAAAAAEAARQAQAEAERQAQAEAARQAQAEAERQAQAEAERQAEARRQEEARRRAANSGTIAGHEWVDLGLPSGLKWATCNVGASSPTGYGNYYSWGETSTKSKYTSSTSKTWRKNLGDISGNAQYDAARANWGGSWRMPTRAEFDELIEYCDWQWTTQNGVKGCKVTSQTNGNSIFLPAAGVFGSSQDSAGDGGYYWSSSPDEDYANFAYYLYISSGGHSTYWYDRYRGYTVRPVSD